MGEAPVLLFFPGGCCLRVEAQSHRMQAQPPALGRIWHPYCAVPAVVGRLKPVRRMWQGGGDQSRHLWYNLVILRSVKTAISLPDETFRRVDRAAKRLGLSRSELFARAAENWLDRLEDDGVTEAINRAIAGLPDDHQFTDAAAAALPAGDQS